MRVPRVRTESGQQAILLFVPERVEIHEHGQGRQLGAKAAAGGFLLAAGLAAVATNAEDRSRAGLGLALWIVCAVFALAGAGGLGWWLVAALRDRGRGPAATIDAASVLTARSTADRGEVTVTLNLDSGETRSFSAVGHAGALLATHFGHLLSVPARHDT